MQAMPVAIKIPINNSHRCLYSSQVAENSSPTDNSSREKAVCLGFGRTGAFGSDNGGGSGGGVDDDGLLCGGFGGGGGGGGTAGL